MAESDENLRKKSTNPPIEHKDDDDTRTSTPGEASSSIGAHHPMKIGQYIIKRIIASGGMGTVYEGMQENPRRPVAIKVIKDTITSENATQRLEYEAQLLARLRHPGIAQIYEAGYFEDNGKEIPFFAMEYIPNAKSISEYVKQKNLRPDNILRLYQQVCDAVHHGHQRGIVHRDLKPSNILVDSNGLIKIIDFGVAKATDSDMRQAVSHTQVGQIVGSVQYMSPEQFDADPHDIDTRSDIYALGVILYELLAKTLPYKTSSDRIFDFAAEVRGGHLIPLTTSNKNIGKEIEALVHKALNNDRDQRYQSAYGLESDIKRYLRGDAISAETLRLSYQLRVFSRKNKLVVGLAGAVVLLLITGIILTTNLYVTVDRERQRTEVAMKKAEQGRQFLTDLLATSATECFGADFTGEQLLDSASLKIARTFPDDYGIALELRKSISKAYVGLGKFNKAISESEKAYGLIREDFDLSNEKMVEAFDNLSFAYNISGRYKDKLEIEREYFDKVIQKYGEKSPETYAAKFYLVPDLERNGFISEANQCAKEAFEGFKAEYGDDDISTLSSQFTYASSLLKTGDHAEAGGLIHDAYARVNKQFNENHSMFDVARRNLARLYITESKIDSAKALYDNRRVPASYDFEKRFSGEDNYGKDRFQLLIFFEEWCPYSRNAMRALGRSDLHYSEVGLDVIGITRCTKNSSVEKIPPYLKALDIDFTVYKDDGGFSNALDVRSFPTLRLIADGYVILESTGFGSNSMTPQMLDGMAAAMKSGSFGLGT